MNPFGSCDVHMLGFKDWKRKFMWFPTTSDYSKKRIWWEYAYTGTIEYILDGDYMDDLYAVLTEEEYESEEIKKEFGVE